MDLHQNARLTFRSRETLAPRLAVFETWDQAVSGRSSRARPVTFISSTVASLTRTGPDSP
jgi:hypothetical protein